MNAICVVQARMGSSRLPGKAMANICGHPMLAHIIERLRTAETVDEFIVATTTKTEDNIIVDLARKTGVSWFRGPVEDVLGRIVQLVKQRGVEIVVHASGDNPLVDPEILDSLVRNHREGDYDFSFMAGLPLGVGVDVFSRRTLMALDRLATNPVHREHVNAYVFDHIDRFKVARLLPDMELSKPQLRLTVDTIDDLSLIRDIYRRLYGQGDIIDLRDVLKLREDEPGLFSMNAHVKQLYVSEIARNLRGTVAK